MSSGLWDDGFAEFEIDPAPIWPADDARLEPIFLAGPLWIEFVELEYPYLDPASVAPTPLAEFEEFGQLNPERMLLQEDEAPPALRRPASAIGLLGSLGAHLLVLALLAVVNTSGAPAEALAAVPVQLVIEERASAPEEAPPDPLAAETTSMAAESPDGGSPAAVALQTPPAPKKNAATVPQAPKPRPPPEPRPERTTRETPAAIPLASTPPPAAGGQSAPAPSPAPRATRAPAPGSGRGSYFDYLVVLTRPHFHMLPSSFLAGRRGRTTLTLVIREDGTIERIAVKQSSGYPDIDTRIQQMVAAVGRFPPLPDGFQRPTVELDFNLAFPDAMQQ